MRKQTMVTAAILAFAAGNANAVELTRATLDAWNDYVHASDQRMQERLKNGATFFWVDEAAGREARVLRGDVVIEPMTDRGVRETQGGLIHHWIGAVFIPNSKLADLLGVVHDYDNYGAVYKPVVTASQTIGCGDTEQDFAMTWQRRVLFVNAAMEGHYHSHDFTVSDERGYNITASTRVQEIQNYGHAGQRLLPAGTGNGFVWQMHSIARYEERNGGVLLELEVLALTRDVPEGLRWLVNPMMNKLSVNSLTSTLRQTREAVNAKEGNTHAIGCMAARRPR